MSRYMSKAEGAKLGIVVPYVHKRGDRVRIGKGRTVWMVLHGDTNSLGRVLVQSESSQRMTTVPAEDMRPVQTNRSDDER